MNAFYYFFGLIGLTGLLFIIALFVPKFKQSKQTPNALAQLHALCQEILGDGYQFALSQKYITLIKNNQKIALLTLDSTLDTHSRKMGDSVILNFKKLPNKKTLEQLFIKEKIIQIN